MKPLIILSTLSLALLSCKKECTDPAAINYQTPAIIDNGPCSYRTKFVIDKIRIRDGAGQNVSVVYRGDTIPATTFLESMVYTTSSFFNTVTIIDYVYALDYHISNGDLEIDDQIAFLVDGQTPTWYNISNNAEAPDWNGVVHVAKWLN